MSQNPGLEDIGLSGQNVLIRGQRWCLRLTSAQVAYAVRSIIFTNSGMLAWGKSSSRTSTE